MLFHTCFLTGPAQAIKSASLKYDAMGPVVFQICFSCPCVSYPCVLVLRQSSPFCPSIVPLSLLSRSLRLGRVKRSHDCIHLCMSNFYPMSTSTCALNLCLACELLPNGDLGAYVDSVFRVQTSAHSVPESVSVLPVCHFIHLHTPAGRFRIWCVDMVWIWCGYGVCVAPCICHTANSQRFVLFPYCAI